MSSPKLFLSLIRTAIKCLFTACCPAAVSRFIVAVHINTLECCRAMCRYVLMVTFSHIFKKVLESLPARAMLNTSTSIVGIVRAVRIVTPLAHIDPTQIKRVAVSVILSPHERHTVRRLAMSTATIIGSRVQEILLSFLREASTLTLKEPHLSSTSLGVPQKLDSCKHLSLSPPKFFGNPFIHMEIIS